MRPVAWQAGRWNFWALDETLRDQIDLADPEWQEIADWTGRPIRLRIEPRFARVVRPGYQGYFEIEVSDDEESGE